MNNIFHSECLKGYFFPLRIGSAHRGSRGDFTCCGASVYHFNFVFCLSASGPTHNSQHSTAYITETNAGRQTGIFLPCGIQSAELHLLVNDSDDRYETEARASLGFMLPHSPHSLHCSQHYLFINKLPETYKDVVQ